MGSDTAEQGPGCRIEGNENLRPVEEMVEWKDDGKKKHIRC